jgi:WD40 repeat protein/transcriptional regulator with XRE-family HTH domain
MVEDHSFGQLVKTRRRELGLTQDELARRVGCAPVTLRKIEYDDLRPSVQIAERLAMALNIPLEGRADFVRQARIERPPLFEITPTPMPRPEEIGQEDLSGRAIRGYALGERIGKGGMGAVYRAVQPIVEREVAVKIILPQYANHPDFIRRFESEAQLVARLEHPHIVPLYDYWREPNTAFLVMRLLRGGSLQKLLEDGPLPLEMTLRVMEQIGAALGTAHRVGVIHRDLKPANILLDEDQNAYLADFGIAKNLGSPNLEDMTQADMIIGSPNYISPEQIRSEFVRPQSDIYCLGVVLYEMLTGAVPFSGPTPIDIMHQHLSAALPPLAARKPGLPGSLDRVIEHATLKDPLARYADTESLLADLRRAIQGGSGLTQLAAPDTSALPPLTAADNPYKGLRAFAEGDAADFFGREALIQQLLVRLGEGGDLSRFLAVVGPSGSGKSSVVKAGLIPALRRGALPGSENWYIVDLLPGAHPFEEIEAALLRIAVNPPESLLSQLCEDKRGLLRAVRRCLPEDRNIELVMVIDQFEELFTLVEDEATRALLLDNLVTAALDERSRVRFVITLRADFTDRPLQYVDFGEVLRQRMEIVLPMTPDELEQAVLRPAERVNLTLEPDLTAAIIRDVAGQPGALPLMEYALTELFDQRDGHRLTKAAYDEIGGVVGALGRRAEEVYSALGESAQSAARQLFLRLVTLGEGTEDTRRRVARAELDALQPPSGSPHLKTTNGGRGTLPIAALRDEEGQAGVSSLPIGGFPMGRAGVGSAVEAFGSARLLAFDRDPITRGPTVEVAHEALLREWPRLRDWLANSREDVRMQRLLAAESAEWLKGQHDPSFLLVGSRLAQFEGWAAESAVALTVDERAYLEASLQERSRQQEEERLRQKRELEAAKKLAETERQRAEEQAANSKRLRQRAWALTGALGLALLLVIATIWLAGAANTNAQQANAEANTRATAEAQALAQQGTAEAERGRADEQKSAALNAQATAESERGRAEDNAAAAVAAQAEAETQRLSAEQQAAINFARELASNALMNLEKDQQLSLLLVLQAISVTQQAGIAPIPWDLQQALHDAVIQSRLFYAIPDVDGLAWNALFSPDGKWIAVYGEVITGVTSIRDASTGQELFSLDGYYVGAFSPDGKWLAMGGSDGVTAIGLIWDVLTGERLITITIGKGGEAFPGYAFSPDGNWLAWSGNGEGDAPRLWDLTAWRNAGAQPSLTLTLSDAVRTLDGCNGMYAPPAFSPDGQRLATNCGLNHSTVKVWDLATGQGLWESPEPAIHTAPGDVSYMIFSVDFSPDGSRVVSCDHSGNVLVWDAATGEQLMSLKGFTGYIQKVTISPDGSMIAAAGKEGIIIWNANNGSRLMRFSSGAFGVDFSPDGNRLVVTRGRTLEMWDVTLAAGGELALKPVSPDIAEVSDDLSLWITGWPDQGMVEFIDTSTFETFSKWQVYTPTVEEPAIYFRPLLSQDNTRLATFYNDIINIWDMTTHRKLMDLRAPGPVVCSVFNSDNTLLAAGGMYQGVTIWDLNTRKELRTLPIPLGIVFWCRFSPDGTRLVVGGWRDLQFGLDARLLIWDLTPGIAQLADPVEIRAFDRDIGYFFFSPDGQSLTAAGSGGVKVYDMNTLEQRFYFPGDSWMSIYSPDGKYIVTANADGTTRVYDSQTGVELLDYGSPENFEDWMAGFTPDGQRIFSLGGDGYLQQFAFLNFDDLVAIAHTRIARTWTQQECRQYLHRESCP